MRVLDRVDPRWVTLLLVPVLLAAGGLHAQPDASAAPVPAQQPVLLLPFTPGEEPLPVLGDAGSPAGPAASAARFAGHPQHLVVRATRSGLRDGPPLTLQERGRAALDALAYDHRTLGYRVRFLPYQGQHLGITDRPKRLITIYVRPGQSELSLRVTLAHELGHALDFVHGTPERREQYRRLRGLPAGPWFPCNRCDDLASPAGDFAEVFAVWLVGPGDFRSRLQGPPDTAQLRRLDRLFRLPAPLSPVARAAPAPAPAPSPQVEADEEPSSGLPDLLRPPSPPPGRP